MTLGVPEDYCLLVNSASQGVQLMPVWREGVEERTRAEWLIEQWLRLEQPSNSI